MQAMAERRANPPILSAILPSPEIPPSLRSSAGSGTDIIYGSDGYDLLTAGTGTTTLAGMGADTLVAGTGADLLTDTADSGSTVLYEVNHGFTHDTIASGSLSNGNTATSENILFGTGVEPSSFVVSAQLGTSNNPAADWSLALTDGSSSILLAGGLLPGTLGSLTFADTGAESVAQLVNADAAAGTVTLPYNVKNVIFSAGNGETATGNSSNSAIFAYGNNDNLGLNVGSEDTIYAYGNGDTVTSGTDVWTGGTGDLVSVWNNGVATITGANNTVVGAGNNQFTVYQGSTVIQENGTSGSSSVFSYVNYTLPTNVQSLTLESSGLEAFSNAAGGNFNAFGDNDTLVGGSGKDSLFADGNDDVLVGGAGAETFILNSLTDTIVFGTGSANTVAVGVYFNDTLTANANTLIEYADSSVATGNSGNDSLIAAGNYDTLVAGSGTDTLAAASSVSAPTTFIEGTGNDTFVLGTVGDIIIDTSSTSTNTVVSSWSYTLQTGINSLQLKGGDDVGTANSGNDSLTASGYAETLVAGAGNDTLAIANGTPSGPVGGDVLVAGTGQDILEDGSTVATNTFLFNSGFSSDQIVGAQNGDIIRFGAGITESSLTFAALAGTTGSAPSFVISGDGGSITVQGGLAPGAVGSVQFSGGTSYTIQQLLDPSGRVTVTGSSGNLILTSSNGDSLTGGSGKDTVVAWGNSDTLTAGTGRYADLRCGR